MISEKHKCQNNEVQVVLDYFKGRIGTVVEIGANDGITLSNSYDLIKMGWSAILIEPSIQFHSLLKLHADNPNVKCVMAAITDTPGQLEFYESGPHVKGGVDHALVSTLDPYEMARWRGVQFKKKMVDCTTIEIVRSTFSEGSWDFISIDVEGLDWEVLKQIDLKDVGCKCLCIEWNGNKILADQFSTYCHSFRFKEIHRNAENLIFSL